MSIPATDTVTITGKGTLQKDGTYSFNGTVTEVNGRVRTREKDQYTPSGVVRMYDYEVWLPSWVDIERGDRLTHNNANHTVVKIDSVTMIDGSVHHKKVFVKRFWHGA